MRGRPLVVTAAEVVEVPEPPALPPEAEVGDHFPDGPGAPEALAEVEALSPAAEVVPPNSCIGCHYLVVGIPGSMRCSYTGRLGSERCCLYPGLPMSGTLSPAAAGVEG